MNTHAGDCEPWQKRKTIEGEEGNMIRARLAAHVPMLAALIWLMAGSALAQGSSDRVEVIISRSDASPHSRMSVRGFFNLVKRTAASLTAYALPLTKCEKWTLPKDQLEGVKKAAAKEGLLVTELGTGWDRLFQATPPDFAISEKQKSLLDLVKRSKATADVKIMAGPSPSTLEYALTKDAKAPAGSQAPKLTVALSDQTVLTVARTSLDLKRNVCIWRGEVEQTGGLVTLMWWPNGNMAGTVQDQGKIYSIRHLGGQFYAVAELNTERMPQEHAALPSSLRASDPTLRDDPLVQQGDASLLRRLVTAMRPPQASAVPAQQAPRKRAAAAPIKPGTKSKDVVIDVIVAYTRKAASNYGDVKRELVDLAIEEGNHSLRMSNLGHIKLRLVHAYQTSYVEDGEHFQHLWRFADRGDRYMDEIHALRDKYRADVGVLIVDDPAGCGLSTRVYADAEDAYSVVHHECAAASYSLAHEIGHLIGARHELALDKNMAPFPYGHGFVNGSKWRDIMSYKGSCGGCPRLPVWSSPNLRVKGDPAGTPDLDNARVVAEQAARVAAFR
jgi:Metallo-peptidase family M12